MEIKELQKEIHQNNVAKGFWEDKETKNVPELLMLCVSELSEALEAHRKGRMNRLRVFNQDLGYARITIEDFTEGNENLPWLKNRFETEIKDTFEDEIADTVIRLLDLSEGLGIDLETHIRLKLQYNKTRPYKHNEACEKLS